MLAALIPLLQPLLAGASFQAVVAGMTVTQWATLGDAILGALPTELKILGALHPLFTQVIADVQKAGNASSASMSAAAWAKQNSGVMWPDVGEGDNR